MKQLLFALGMALLIAGCRAPLRIQMTGPDGTSQEIEVKKDGKVVEVGDDLRKKIEALKPAMENAIKAFLEDRVKNGDFKKDYVVPLDAVVANGIKEPLSDDDKAAILATGEVLTREYVKQIVYPAWAKKIVSGILTSARAKLETGDYAETREIIWGIEKTGVPEVDELVRRLGNRFLNKEVNPAEWFVLEKTIQTKFDEAMAKKDYARARKIIDEIAEIRAFSKLLSKAPSPMADETEDTLKVVDGKASGLLGTFALNARLAKFKEKLLADVMEKILAEVEETVAALVKSEDFNKAKKTVRAVSLVKNAEWDAKIKQFKEKKLAEIAAAEKAYLDAKMTKFVDELTAKVISLVESCEFSEARDTIRDVALIKNDEWDAKIYAVRIGLMNSVVNPNQLKYLKAEAAKTIDALMAEKKYAEVIKFIDEYPYVHDTFDQIMKSFDMIEKAMKTLKLEDKKSADYVASRLASIREKMEKRLGKYNGNEDYSELERALNELEKGYIEQHYDGKAATSVTNTIKGEIVAMVDAKYAPLTTWEMNEALRRFLDSKRPRLPAKVPEKVLEEEATVQTEAAEIVPVPTLGVISDEVDYDSQIAMAEAAIAKPSAVYGLEAVLGDYARIMRRCKAGNAVKPGEANTMLIASVFLNQPEMFKLALTLKGDVNAAARRDDLVRAPILLAVELGRLEFVKLIQDADGKYDVVDARGWTLLHYAAERGNLALVRAAVSAVKIDAVNNDGETALFVAVRRNQLAVAKVMLQLAGDADAQKKFVAIANRSGQTAFDVACVSNAHMLLDTLADAGAEYDERQLAAALTADCIGVAQWFVEKGFDVNADVVRKAADNPPIGNTTCRYLMAEGLKPSLRSSDAVKPSPEEAKPAEAKPVEAKPAEKPAETKAAEKPADKSVE